MPAGVPVRENRLPDAIHTADKMYWLHFAENRIFDKNLPFSSSSFRGLKHPLSGLRNQPAEWLKIIEQQTLDG